MTVAFDLDGTLAEPTWPRPVIGAPIDKAVDAAREYSAKGYELIIFTSRPRSHRSAIQRWLVENNLHFVFYDVVTDKPRAAMYVDDRAVTFPEAFEPLFAEHRDRQTTHWRRATYLESSHMGDCGGWRGCPPR
jgi:hypothetical protein